jgi:hypothetical protein
VSVTTISAKSILASRHALDSSKRIDTLLLRYPRCIHSEFMTHRVFSRNAASSRAIPVEKLIQDVLDDPFVPLHWGKNQKGMQADEECDEIVEIYHGREARLDAWLLARDAAVSAARAFAKAGYHKQIINRLLEPWMHITVVATSTNWSNFLHLRDHRDAEPHMQLLAREIRKALDGAEFQTLEPGQWHLPFVDDEENKIFVNDEEGIKLSVARCASTSYKTVDGFDMTLERAIELHDKLVGSNPLHASPCEHQAKADDYGLNGINRWHHPGLGGNLGEGWIQYRKTLKGECR